MQIHHSIFGAQTQLVPFGWQYKGWQITFEFKVCFWNNIDFCDNPQNKKCLLQPVCTLSFKWNIKTVGGWIWVQLFFLFLCRVHLSGQPTLTQCSNRGRFLVRFSLRERHRDRSIQLRRSPTPNFCATKSCEKGGRTANRSTFTIEKSTPGLILSIWAFFQDYLLDHSLVLITALHCKYRVLYVL